VIRDRAAPSDLDERDKNSKRETADERHTHEQQRVRERGTQDFEHGPVVRERPTEVSVGEPANVPHELLG
jgi:hypothetical protein